MSGKPAARVGDKVAGNVIVSGSATVLIGDAGQGCADKACKGSPSVGSPVNPMLGVKVLPGETDFALAAPSPFAFTRSYASDDARIGPLGQGWSIPGASLYLEVSETATVMVDPQGRRITFDALAPGESLFSPSESLWIRRGGPVPGEGAPPPKAWDGRWIGVPEAVQRNPHAIVAMSASDHDAHVFLAGPTRWRLAQVVDRNGYATEYQWSATGDLRAICDSAGRIYALVYVAHPTTRAGDPGLRLAGVVLAFDPGRDDRPRATFDPLAPDNDWLVRYGHDAEGDLVEVTDRMGHAVRYFGYRQHIMVRHGQPGGIDVHYVYDAYTPQGRVLAQRQADGLDYTFEYGEHRTVVKDSLGRVDEYHFAGQGGLRRLARHVRADGSVVTRQYDAAGRLVAVVDPLGRVTRFRLDGEGREIGVTYPDGAHEATRRDPDTGDLLETEDPLGRRRRIERDARGRLVAETGPDGATTRHIYGDAWPDRPCQIVDARGGVVHLTWTRLGQLARHRDCSGRETAYEYDSDGHLARVVDASGTSVRFEFDRMGRIRAQIHQDGTAVQYGRDALGRLVTIIDPAGQTTTFRHDRAGRVRGRTNPQGCSRSFAHDPAGRLISIVNENGAAISFQYDFLDRLVQETGLDGRWRKYGHDLAGSLVELTESGNRVTRFERDPMGRLTGLHVPASRFYPAHVQRFSHDAAGQLLEAVTPDVTVRLRYDLGGRIVSETQQHADGWVYHHQHELDALGVRQSSHYDGAPVIRWMTYGSGHVHGVRVDRFGLDFERDEHHREVRRKVMVDEMAVGIEGRRGYDRFGRISTEGVSVAASPGVASASLSRDYRFNALGQLVLVRDAATGETGYRYDASGRLVGITDRSGLERPYLLDPAGNRTMLDDAGEGYAGPGPSLLDNRSPGLGGTTCRHDAHGNMVEMVRKGGDRLELGYDGLHRLVTVRRTGVDAVETIAQYRYDAFGRRVSKKIVRVGSGSIETLFGWDGDRMVAEVTNRLVHTIVYAPASFEPLMRVSSARRDASPWTGVPDPEILGMVSAGELPAEIEDMTAIVADRRGAPWFSHALMRPLSATHAVDAWGKAEETEEGSDLPLRLLGQYFDAESGLSYNRHRYYDPDLGVYLSQDPIGFEGGLNYYQYAMGDPLGHADPLGLAPTSCDRCCQLRKNIYEKGDKLLKELRKYDPVADGKGGFLTFGGRLTKPGGHFKEIQDLQRGIKNDITEYNKDCKDKDDGDGGTWGPAPRSIDEMANRPVAPPVIAAPSAPMSASTAGLIVGGVLLGGVAVACTVMTAGACGLALGLGAGSTALAM